MYKIAVVGDRDSIYGFAAVGLDIYPVSDAHTALRTLRGLSEQNYAIVYLTEALVSELGEDLAPYRDRPLPAVIAIPGAYGNTGVGMAGVKKSVERAVGSDIIFGNS
jgi:V/A-type H+-transporting ATPase subunit F